MPFCKCLTYVQEMSPEFTGDVQLLLLFLCFVDMLDHSWQIKLPLFFFCLKCVLNVSLCCLLIAGLFLFRYVQIPVPKAMGRCVKNE